MFKNKEEIQKLVNTFCEKNNIDSQMFEVSTISEATGGKSKRLYNNTPVVNKKCRFIIKYFRKHELIIIWTYKSNSGMSYSLTTIKDKLSKGIRVGDKGTEQHNKNQELVFFDISQQLEQLLYLVVNKL